MTLCTYNYWKLIMLKINLAIFYVKFMNGTFVKTGELINIWDIGQLRELYKYCPKNVIGY